MEWISVKDNLPEVGVSVLAYDGHGITWSWYFDADRAEKKHLNKAGFYYDGGTEFGNHYNYDEVDNVTHWMPLPEPPKQST